MIDTHGYPENSFVKISTESPPALGKFLYKTHPSMENAALVSVKNQDVSSGLLNFYDIRLGTADGIHMGYYIETPYSVNVTCNFLTLRRVKIRAQDQPQLSFKLPSLCIYTLGSSAMVLVSDALTQSLANTIRVQ